jgi:hypothetical protein
MPKVRFPTKMRAAMANALPCCLESGRFGHRQRSFSTPHDGLAASRGTPDLLGEHCHTGCPLGCTGRWYAAGTGPRAILGASQPVDGRGGRRFEQRPGCAQPPVQGVPLRFEHQRCTRASGYAAEPFEMLGKLRRLDVLILAAGHGQSVSALALVLPRRDQTGLVRGDQRRAIRWGRIDGCRLW